MAPTKKATTARKTTKKTAAKKVVAETPAVTSTEAPAVAPALTTAPVDDTSASKPAKTWRGFSEVIEDCLKQAQAQVVSSRAMVSVVREAHKSHDREMREATKNTRKRRQNKSGVKKPLTGFAKPCRISDELADFLHDVVGNADIKRGMEMSRTDVTRQLNEYFVKNNLRDENDKRIILYKKDPKLVTLLGGGVPSGKNLTYFNLQSAIKDKFVKE